MLERNGDGQPALFEVMTWYERRLAHNAAEIPEGWWAYGHYADGTPIPTGAPAALPGPARPAGAVPQPLRGRIAIPEESPGRAAGDVSLPAAERCSRGTTTRSDQETQLPMDMPPPLSLDALRVRLQAAIADRAPFSAIRLGDGEGRVMGYPEYVTDALLGDIWRTWFGHAAYRTPQVSDLRAALREACRTADVIGVPDAAPDVTSDFGRVAALLAREGTVARGRPSARRASTSGSSAVAGTPTCSAGCRRLA